MNRYRPEDHALWRFLFDRQVQLAKTHGCAEFIAGLEGLDIAGGIPDFERANRRLRRLTGWEVVAVPGFLPSDVFFSHLAHRRFPVSWWIRDPSEIDYLVEPDVFHDFFGHVPLLSHPTFADAMQLFGEQGLAATDAGSIQRLSRLYWYTVEFGLIRSSEGMRAYGAGILSSFGETRYAIESAKSHHIAFEMKRVLRTEFRLDEFQASYFVLDDFTQLFEASRRDLLPLYRELDGQADISPTDLCDGDEILPIAA